MFPLISCFDYIKAEKDLPPARNKSFISVIEFIDFTLSTGHSPTCNVAVGIVCIPRASVWGMT